MFAVKCILVLGSLALVGLAACTRCSSIYRIAVPRLPEKFDPWRDTQLNSAVFYNALYHPLFEKGQVQSPASAFFDMKKTSANTLDFRSYKLCLRQNIQFSDASAITISDVIFSLSEVHKYFPLVPTAHFVEQSARCVLVTLAYPDPNYFEHLSTIRATILKRSTVSQRIPTGLGPYRIVSKEKYRLFLDAIPEFVPGDLKNLVFILVDEENASKYDRNIADDWNLTGPPLHLESVHAINDKKFTRLIPGIDYIGINYPNQELRRQLSQCLDRAKMIELTRATVLNRDSIFPVGFSGVTSFERHETRKNRCHFEGKRPKLIYYHLDHSNFLEVQNFFLNAGRSLPFEVLPVKSSPREVIDAYTQKKEMLYLGIIEADLNPESFLMGWKRLEEAVPGSASGLMSLISKIMNERNPAKRLHLLQLADQEVHENAPAIILGQTIRTFTFPDDLTNIEMPFLGNALPQYHLIKRRRARIPAIDDLLGWLRTVRVN